MSDGRPARIVPPKPPTRAMEMSALARWRAARRSIFDALKPTLYNAWLAELKTPFRNSYFVNDPSILKVALHERPDDFPKANSIRASLRDLLGEAVFLTNGEAWKRQRRMIDPAFEGGRLRDTFPAMVAAAESCADRLATRADGQPIEMEFETSYFAADVIFRTLFSEPIETGDAQEIFTAFRRYQQTAPILNALDLMNAPRWIPRPRRWKIRREARRIRALLRRYVDRRAAEIAAGTAPDDLATKIMTTVDPVTGERFTAEEMLDQVAIFFLAGHETSASALGWALYLLARDADVQRRAAAEADGVSHPPAFGDIKRLAFTRDVYRETLRLYPPVPMMVRETAERECFRKRDVARGSIFIMSPWHLHRHQRLWRDGDVFDPDRWTRPEEADSRRDAYMPFSAGPRVCSGAGFAMLEGVLLLTTMLRRFQIGVVADRPPAPVTQLTVRSETGIWLTLRPRR